MYHNTTPADMQGSLSARRAWIEISVHFVVYGFGVVALRKESVDRNLDNRHIAWYATVALRKESVDRNPLGTHIKLGFVSRSPQGERG